MYVIYVNDTETTGTDPVKNDIIELSMARLLFEKNNINLDQKTWYFRPINSQNIDDEALKVNGYKREDLLHHTEFGQNTFKSPMEVLPQIELWMDEDNCSVHDRLFVGHNPDFDTEFMLQTWKKCGSEATFPFEISNQNRVLDTKQIITFIDLCTGKRRKFYNLSSVVKAFGVKKGKAHKAEEDVRMTADLLLKLLLPVRDHLGKIFDSCYDE